MKLAGRQLQDKSSQHLMPMSSPHWVASLLDVTCTSGHVCVCAGYWNGSLVAVKVLEQVAGDFNPRSSLEPLLHHRLGHPNIVAMYDVCTQVGMVLLCCCTMGTAASGAADLPECCSASKPIVTFAMHSVAVGMSSWGYFTQGIL